MNGLLLLIISVAVLVCGYIFYGRWLCKQWGVGENDKPTPAHTMEDGIDYVPAKAPILMGHHFSSIAGAGPITGPINAAGFGWLACTLWILVGGIFFGGVHDFGALFASVRHGGKSIGEIISTNMSRRAKTLFLIFAYLTLILVVAAFASIVAGTFGATFTETGVVDYAASEANARVAMVSLLFILIAIVFGFLVYRRNAPMSVASVVGVIAIVVIIAIGMNFHPIYLSKSTWMWICGVYIAVASVTPVWILLQPRDYLSSFLLYAMLALAVWSAPPGRRPVVLAARNAHKSLLCAAALLDFDVAWLWPESPGQSLCACPVSPAALERAHDRIAADIAALLEEGKTVAYITLGDPSIYSTYLYIHRRVLAAGYEAKMVPGVPSFCAVAAQLGDGLCEGSDRLLIVPASHRDVADCLAVDANLVFMKAGRELGALRQKLEDASLLEGAAMVVERAAMVENCGMDGERVFPRFAEAPEDSGYFSVVVVKRDGE